MFSNLSQNSIIYILETKGKPRLLSGTVEALTPPRPQYSTFGQMSDLVVDITALVEGEKREFKKIPYNNTIANFGPEAFVLADSKESINSYIGAAIQNSKNIINSYEKHKQLVEDLTVVYEELNPSLKADKEKDKIIQSLQEQINTLNSSMDKILDFVTKQEDNKK